MEKSVSVFYLYINNLRKKGAGKSMVDVLPSSIHECIIVPNDGFDEKDLQNMVISLPRLLG